MKLCPEHWSEIKQKVEEQGMRHLIARSDEELTARLKVELESGVTKDTFDPLLAAHNMILSNALHVAGLVLFISNDDGSERCPLCYLISGCPCGEQDCEFKRWPDLAAEGAKAEAISLGLVGEG